MPIREITVKKALGFGWDTLKKDPVFLCKVALIYVLVSVAPGFFNKIQSPFLQLIISGGLMVISTVVGMGVIRISLNYYDNEPSSYSDLFNLVYLFFRYLMASLILLLVFIVGIILLIVPGIFYSVRFSFFDYAIVDREAGVLDSLKISYRLTGGYFWTVFLFGLALLGLNIIGFCLLGVGILPTLAVTMLARGYMYRKLQEANDGH